MLGTHIGPTHSHTSARTHTIAFRGVTALWGHAGLEWDLTETTAEERVQLKAWTEYYKANRELLHSGRVTRMDSIDGNSWIHGVVAQDGSRAIFAYVALELSQYVHPMALVLGGLENDALYNVKVVTPFGGYEEITRSLAGWIDGVTLDGRYLQTVGLSSPILKPEQAFLLEVTRVG